MVALVWLLLAAHKQNSSYISSHPVIYKAGGFCRLCKYSAQNFCGQDKGWFCSERNMAALTMGRDHDPKYFLQVENSRRNVFVTQLGELREEEDENVFHIPIIHKVPSDILQLNRKTVQRTLRLRKEAELNQVTAELIRKKEEFRERMEELAKQTEEFIQNAKNDKKSLL